MGLFITFTSDFGKKWCDYYEQAYNLTEWQKSNGNGNKTF